MVEGVTEQLSERITWLPARSVGTARISDIVRPRPEQDMVFLDLRNDAQSSADMAAKEYVFVPHGIFQVGMIAEIIVKPKRFPSSFQRRLQLSADCLVALRPFQPQTYGKITTQDEESLRPMFSHEANRKNALDSRAFFIRFLNASVKRITAKDIRGPGQHL